MRLVEKKNFVCFRCLDTGCVHAEREGRLVVLTDRATGSILSCICDAGGRRRTRRAEPAVIGQPPRQTNLVLAGDES